MSLNIEQAPEAEKCSQMISVGPCKIQTWRTQLNVIIANVLPADVYSE